MDVIDKGLLLVAAKLSSAVYIEDLVEMKKEMEALGFTFLGLVTNGKDKDSQGDHQVAVLKATDKRNVLVCRGTQVEENFSLSELLDDNDTTLTPSNTFNGFKIPLSMQEEVLRLIDKTQPIDIFGHSKGGSEAENFFSNSTITLPKIRVVSFGAPCVGTKTYWDGVKFELFRVIAEGDFAPGWGLDSNGWQPVPAVLLTEGKDPQWTTAEHYKTLLEGGLKFHSITNSYIRLLSE